MEREYLLSPLQCPSAIKWITWHLDLGWPVYWKPRCYVIFWSHKTKEQNLESAQKAWSKGQVNDISYSHTALLSCAPIQPTASPCEVENSTTLFSSHCLGWTSIPIEVITFYSTDYLALNLPSIGNRELPVLLSAKTIKSRERILNRKEATD